MYRSWPFLAETSAAARALIETNRRVNPRLPETLRANAELAAIEGHA